MFEIPEKEQWQEVFALALDISEKEPWKTYPEECIFILHGEDENDTLYVSVHGFEEEVTGISVHKTKEDISRYVTILEKGDDADFQTIIANQSCVSLQFAAREYLSPGDITAAEQAGFTPKDERNCVLFRKYAPGFAPWYADKNDIELLIKGVRRFLEATKDAAAAKFDKTITILEHKNGEFTVFDLPENFKEIIPDIKKDDLFVARLKQLKRNAKVIEIDSCYLPNPVSGQLSEVPLFPKFCVIADADEGFIADQCIFEETTEEEDAFFLFLSNYFKKNGLPRKIRIKKENTGHFLHDLCKRLHIELDERNSLPIVDDFMTMINGITPGE